MNHFNPPTHRMRALGLMRSSFSGIPNRGVHLLNRSLHSFLQLNAASQHCQPLIGLAPGQSNRRYCLPGPLLQGYDVSLDVAGRALRLAGQRPHFIGHHRKAAPSLASPCRFDGRVESEQVGLLGDATDHVEDLADPAAIAFQLADDLHRIEGRQQGGENPESSQVAEDPSLCRGCNVFKHIASRLLGPRLPQTEQRCNEERFQALSNSFHFFTSCACSCSVLSRSTQSPAASWTSSLRTT